MTDSMTAIEIAEFGGPEVLRPVQRPLPAPAAGELLIEVAAAGVNRPDVLQRQGGYRPPPGASDIPGLEIAGRVATLGAAAASLLFGVILVPALGPRFALLLVAAAYLGLSVRRASPPPTLWATGAALVALAVWGA